MMCVGCSECGGRTHRYESDERRVGRYTSCAEVYRRGVYFLYLSSGTNARLILPAHGKTLLQFISDDPQRDIFTFLLTASAVGYVLLFHHHSVALLLQSSN